MRRSFLVNVSFLLILNLLVKPLWIFGIDVQVQNRVGAADYGFYFALFNFAFLFNMILDFGITNFNQRLVARKAERIADYLSNILLVKIVLATAYYSLVYVVAWLLGFSGEQLSLLFWIALNRILLSFLLYFRSNISGLQHYRTDALLSVLDRGLMIVFCGAMLFGDVLGRPFVISDFVYAQTAALGLAALAGMAAVRLHHGRLQWSWNRRLFRAIVMRSYPFALLALLMTLYNRMDGVMIERLLGEQGKTEAGVYAAAYRLLDALSMFGYLFATILLPLFSRMLKHKEPVERILRQGFLLIFVVAATSAASGWFYRDPIMQLLYIEADAYYARCFGWLILGFPLIAVVYIYGTLLTAAGKLRALNGIAIGGVVLNLAMNYVLIPKQGAYGAVVATLFTQFLVAVLHLVVVMRVFQFGMPWGAVLRCVVFGGAAIGFAAAGRWLPIPLLGQLAAVGLAALGLAFALRMVEPRAFLVNQSENKKAQGEGLDLK